MTSPAVTVLMCVYNGERFLRPAIECILDQSFFYFEFLIVDDASTDASADIIGSYDDERIVVVRNTENLGLTRSLNRGLDAARAPLIARHDADDISHPARLAAQVKLMDAQPDIAVVGAQAALIDEQGRVSGRLNRATSVHGVHWHLMVDAAVVHSSAMFRREVIWEQLGGYDPEFRTSQDADLWTRVAKSHRVINLSMELVQLRVHGGSVSAGYNRDSHERTMSVWRDNLHHYLNSSDTPNDRWLELNMQMSFPGPMSRGDARALVDGYAAILRGYCRRFPDAANDVELGRAAARSLCRVAAYLAPRQRRESVRALIAAARADRATTRAGLAKVGSLLVLGERARMLYRRLRDRRA